MRACTDAIASLISQIIRHRNKQQSKKHDSKLPVEHFSPHHIRLFELLCYGSLVKAEESCEQN